MENAGKLIKLPDDPKEIVERLTKVLDEHNIVEKIYYIIAESAGRELYPQGVVMMFTLAAHDFSLDYGAIAGNVTLRFIPRWIDALIDDKDAAEQAKSFLSGVEEKVEKDRKAKEPPRVQPAGPVENDELYTLVRRVGEIFFEEVGKAKLDKWTSIQPWADIDEVNPFYCQTDQGLFLEYYYGLPSKVWTPWGEWDFVGSTSHTAGDEKKFLPKFLERVGAVLVVAEYNDRQGTHGPIYAIRHVDNTNLPKPQNRERQNYLEYEVSKKAWKNMTKRWKKSNSKK